MCVSSENKKPACWLVGTFSLDFIHIQTESRRSRQEQDTCDTRDRPE